MRAFAILACGLTLLVAAAFAVQPPPVIRNLGPYSPTPQPSPQMSDRIRLVTSITLRNKPDGESIVAFEVQDLAKARGKDKASTTYRALATQLYSLSEPKKDLVELRDEILLKIRALEEDLLEFAERAGPPRERQRPAQSQGGRY